MTLNHRFLTIALLIFSATAFTLQAHSESTASSGGAELDTEAGNECSYETCF